MADCISGHTIEVFDRGGANRVGPIEQVSSVKWGRKRDGVSEATVVVEGSACSDQAALLGGIEPHRSEIVIRRGGERVWEGPVNRVTWTPDRVEINAHDVIEYLMHTPLSRTWSNAYPNTGFVSTRLEDIIEWELTHSFEVPGPGGGTITSVPWEGLDPPVNLLPYLTVHHWPNEAETSMVTEAFEMTVGEHLKSCARTKGIDYTAVGRAIHIWDTSRNLGRLQQMTDGDFTSDVIVTAYGADQTTFAFVVAEDDEGNLSIGRAGISESYYGPWAKVFTVYDEDRTREPSQADLDSQAKRNISGRTPVPIEVRVPDNTGIILSDTLTIADLVPGVQIPLLASLSARQVSQMQKLDTLNVSEDGKGETIQVTLTPATKPDADDEED